jgi:glycosyltransferase involved in cell wall biosynthesis
MNVLITLEHRFERAPDGSVWTQTMFSHPFWLRYLAVFDGVRVAARLRDVRDIPSDWRRADGEGVAFAEIPYYVGPWQYLLRAGHVARSVRNALRPTDAVILRVPSQIAASLSTSMYRNGHAFGLEVVGDPHDVFALGGVRHPLRPFFRWWFSRELRLQCRRAAAVAYVTEHVLQRRYPPASSAFSTHYSSVELTGEAYVSAPRPALHDKQAWTLVTVASLAQLYKGPDILIRAVAACVREGLDLRLVVVGDGKYRQELEALATSHGLAGRVCFRGQVPPGDAVRNQLDQADLFVLPSRADGLPRALIEAMARGLPCLGSSVGGIPELLPRENLVPPGKVEALVDKILEVLRNPQRLAGMSEGNWAKAQEYRDEVLQARRTAYYRYVRDMTESRSD